jgi:hypothetical protein
MSPDLKLFQSKVFISAAAAVTALNLQFNLHLKFLITILNSRKRAPLHYHYATKRKSLYAYRYYWLYCMARKKMIKKEI